MKGKKSIVHITTIDIGGAYKAVNRIVKATNILNDVEADILLRNKCDESNLGHEFLTNFCTRFISKCRNYINNIFFSQNEIKADRFGCSVENNKIVRNADIIVIHWINSFLSIKSIKQILDMGKPTIIMLHDMWHITGGCAYSGECEDYLNDCSQCVILKKDGGKCSLAHKALCEKEEAYHNKNVTVVAPGTWIAECARQGRVFKNHPVRIIPNCLDIDVFRHYEKKEARNILGITGDRPVVLYIAMSAGINNKRKGFDYLVNALSHFEDGSLELVVVGNVDEASMTQINQQKKYLGYVGDEKRLALAYSAADITVVPSLQETFCYTSCESLACGTPVVAFKVGGLIDQIQHMQNGYLADIRNSDDLARGIQYFIDNPKDAAIVRESVLKFGFDNIAEKWDELFNSILYN